mmetsp:Transcript_13479/g.18467  ORF Transcript_13479/g.18467 Transcript_13479/m.18467 type:complete len:151 (-) Transcript_13479:122-574(-)
MIENEVALRKRIGRIYNKRQSEFESLLEYNDYLEEVEDIVFNISEGIDVATTESRIAKYKKENEENIAFNQANKAEMARQWQGKSNVGGVRLQEDAAKQGAGTVMEEEAVQPIKPLSKMELKAALIYAGGYSEESTRRRAISECYDTLFL